MGVCAEPDCEATGESTVNARSKTVAMSVGLVAILVAAVAYVMKSPEPPLHQFARTGDVEKAELFIDHGADLHARDEDICSTPLGWAAKYGRRHMVELLLGRGARSNLPDDPAWATPLAWATRRGHSDIVELLKQHGGT